MQLITNWLHRSSPTETTLHEEMELEETQGSPKNQIKINELICSSDFQKTLGECHGCVADEVQKKLLISTNNEEEIVMQDTMGELSKIFHKSATTSPSLSKNTQNLTRLNSLLRTPSGYAMIACYLGYLIFNSTYNWNDQSKSERRDAQKQLYIALGIAIFAATFAALQCHEKWTTKKKKKQEEMALEEQQKKAALAFLTSVTQSLALCFHSTNREECVNFLETQLKELQKNPGWEIWTPTIESKLAISIEKLKTSPFPISSKHAISSVSIPTDKSLEEKVKKTTLSFLKKLDIFLPKSSSSSSSFDSKEDESSLPLLEELNHNFSETEIPAHEFRDYVLGEFQIYLKTTAAELIPKKKITKEALKEKVLKQQEPVSIVVDDTIPHFTDRTTLTASADANPIHDFAVMDSH